MAQSPTRTYRMRDHLTTLALAQQQDPRWNLLKKGERRQLTTEYQNQRRKDELREERARAKKAKDAFLKMLATNFSIDGKFASACICCSTCKTGTFFRRCQLQH